MHEFFDEKFIVGIVDANVGFELVDVVLSGACFSFSGIKIIEDVNNVVDTLVDDLKIFSLAISKRQINFQLY